MNFDFSRYNITLVLGPVDMRCGYDRLAMTVSAVLDIEVDQGRDCVIFISKSRSLAKMIWHDERGKAMLTRRLHGRRFEKFLSLAIPSDALSLSVDELKMLLDGEPLYVRRRDLIKVS